MTWQKCLEIIEVGETALCRRDITISKSEKIFEYVFKKKTKETGAISLLTLIELNQGEMKKFVTL